MAVLAPVASAWSLSSAPALVQDLQAAFVMGLREGLASTPYLSNETRAGIENLLRRDGSPRQIGDSLMICYASSWANRLAKDFGSDKVNCSWHGPERLFESLSQKRHAVAAPGLELKKTQFLKKFRQLDLISRAILEVRFPTQALSRFHSERLAADFSFLDAEIGGLGFALCALVDRGDEGESVFRFSSLTVMEMGLHVFLDDSAPRFCLGPARVPPGTFNELHKAGYQLVGAPTHRRKIHGVWTPPLGFIWNDICHGSYWSTHEEAPERLAATLLYESANRTLNGERRLEPVATQLDHLLNLELSVNGGVLGILGGLQSALLPDRFGTLAEDFAARLDVLTDPEIRPYVQDLRRELRALH